jgi:hypothetical protein
MSILAIIVLVLLGAFLALQAWRWSDNRNAAQVWLDLSRKADRPDAFFDPSMVESLPEPARRFFLFTISPGTPVRTVSEIRTRGQIALGAKNDPGYQPMRAEQILAPPHGLVWRLRAGRGVLRLSGSDGFDGNDSWVRFWLLNTLPIVRAGGNADHARAAFGRVVAEAAFWTPAALLPQTGVSWEAAGADVARATVACHGVTQTVDITLAEDGRPIMVAIPRWSDANPEKRYRLQPFGGYLSRFRHFDGYTLPTRVEGGNFIGTEDYFAFYKAQVDDLRFIGPE